MCNGNEYLKPPFACVRDLWFGRQGDGTDRAGRLSYMYLMSDERWQQQKLVELWRQSDRPAFGRERGAQEADGAAPHRAYDAIVLQCPLWTMYKPDAYNLSISRTKRHAVRRPPSFEVFGQGCARILEVIRNLSRGEATTVGGPLPSNTAAAPTVAAAGGRQLTEKTLAASTPPDGWVRGWGRHATRRSCRCCPQIYVLGVATLPKGSPKFPPGDEARIIQVSAPRGESGVRAARRQGGECQVAAKEAGGGCWDRKRVGSCSHGGKLCQCRCTDRGTMA